MALTFLSRYVIWESFAWLAFATGFWWCPLCCRSLSSEAVCVDIAVVGLCISLVWCVSNSHVRAMQVYKPHIHTHTFWGGGGSRTHFGLLGLSPLPPPLLPFEVSSHVERETVMFLPPVLIFDQQITFLFLFSSAQSMFVNTVEPCYIDVASNMEIPSL